MNWEQIVEKVTPYIVRIETPTGYGTGFLYLHNEAKTFCGIATANHVVSDVEEWQQPIRIRNQELTQVAFLKEGDRVIFTDWQTDSAVILFPKSALNLPEELIPLLPVDRSISIGTEVGWLGFPSIEPYTLCFFSGNISARPVHRKAYLIDGVAINGVSGGPVIYSTEADGVKIIGVVTAYQPNRTVGGSLPGLLFAQDLSHFHDVINQIKTSDEARHQKEQFEQQQPQEPGEQPKNVPSPSPSETPIK